MLLKNYKHQSQEYLRFWKLRPSILRR